MTPGGDPATRPIVLLAGSQDAPSQRALVGVLVPAGFLVRTQPGFDDSALAGPGSPVGVLLPANLLGAALPDRLRGLRTRHPALVIVLTGVRTDPVEEIVALELGADVVATVRMPARLIVARLRGALRRVGAVVGPAPSPGPAEPAALGHGLVLDLAERAARRADGTRVPLTRAEAATLALLAMARGRTVTRERISQEVLERAWSYEDRSVDNLVLGLRRKLGIDRDFGPIRTVRNAGYRLVDGSA